MIQVVRRHPYRPTRVLASTSRRERFLEIAFVSLAAINLFVITSGAMLYFLAHKH
jgi:hypothetical protein